MKVGRRGTESASFLPVFFFCSMVINMEKDVESSTEDSLLNHAPNLLFFFFIDDYRRDLASIIVRSTPTG